MYIEVVTLGPVRIAPPPIRGCRFFFWILPFCFPTPLGDETNGTRRTHLCPARRKGTTERRARCRLSQRLVPIRQHSSSWSLQGSMDGPSISHWPTGRGTLVV